MNKKEARKYYKKIRADISEAKKKSQSEAIVRKILDVVADKTYDGILMYAPLKDEVDVRGVFEALKNSANFYFPRVNKDTMDFYSVKGYEDLCIQSFNVNEPKDYCEELKLSKNKKYLCIVPGVSFDKKGGRIGYGKGFYDKYLSMHKEYDIDTVGVCFKECLSDEIETDSYDIFVKMILTTDE